MRKVKNDFSWPFSKRRQTWIAEGDRLSNLAADAVVELDLSGDESPSALKARKRAAAMYEHAAEYYRKSGLGLAAKNSLIDAAIEWGLAGNRDADSRCERAADDIETYWGEEEEEDDTHE